MECRTMRETDLVVNVQSAVEDFYPGLTQKQKDLLSEKIYYNFDYSLIYNQLHDDLEFYANSENIDLSDKDGIDERIVTLKVINGGKS